MHSSYNPPPRLCYPTTRPQHPFAAIPTTAFASSSSASIAIPLSGTTRAGINSQNTMYANTTAAAATATKAPEPIRRRHQQQQPITTMRITPYDSTDPDIDINMMNDAFQQDQQQGRQFWVREVDGSYTLRVARDIPENCQPGSWTNAASGYPYFVREMPGSQPGSGAGA